MAEFVCKNKWIITYATVILGCIGSWIDYKIEMESNSLVQWCIFILCSLIIIYSHFLACVDDIEWKEEYHSFESSLQDKQVSELIGQSEEEHPFHSFQTPTEYKSNKQEDGNSGLDNPKEKVFYVVQPVHVTQEEFNNTIKPQIDMEQKDTKNTTVPKVTLAPAKAKLTPVVGYSLHNINKKYRAMYADICEFATKGEPKTEDAIATKIKLYGHPVVTERPEDGLVAFELQSDPKLRVPESGYFGVK